MSFRTGTATDHEDLFDLLIDFLQDPVASNGAGWTVNRTDSALATGELARSELTAPGLSDDEEINCCLTLYEDLGLDVFGIGLMMSPDWQSGLAWDFQTNQSVEIHHPIWDTSMTYWFYGNKQRVIILTKVSTVYSSSYMGRFLPYGSKEEYGLPWYVGSTAGLRTTRWSSVSENNRGFWDPTYGYMMDPAGQWRLTRNAHELSGESLDYVYVNIWPYNGSVSSGEDAVDRWREVRDNVDGSYSLFPQILISWAYGPDIYGELDGSYAIAAFSAGSEDTVAIGADDYRVFQLLHRGTRYYYAAMKEE